MANSVNLPAPYAGIDQRIPVAALKSPNCENLFNFNVNNAGISLRHGDSLFSTFTKASGASDVILGLYNYGDTKLIMPIKESGTNFIKFYDAETGVNGYTTVNSLATTNISSTYFNKYLFFFTNTSTLAPGVVWNGAAFAACGYTGTNLWPIAGCVYKNRMYMAQLNEAAFWYSEIDSVSGACTKVDLSGITSQLCTLSGIGTFTISEQTTTQEYIAFIFSNGEVLFYSGTYPNSPTWGLIGRAKIAQVVCIDPTIKYQGDTIVMTDGGIVSMRDLFLMGSNKAQNLTVNSKMQETWKSLIQRIRISVNNPNGPVLFGTITGNIRGIFDSKNSRIIIELPFYFTGIGTQTGDGNTLFTFDTIRESWFFHRNYSGGGSSQNVGRIMDIVSYKNQIVMPGMATSGANGIFSTMQKEGSSGFTDRDFSDSTDIAYPYEMLSAPIPFPKTAVYEADQIEPVIQSDLYTQTNWNFVADFGRQTSGNQPLTDQGTSVTKPAVNVGMQNITYVQVKMSGTTTSGKTVGLDLYSYNVWYDHGQEASR